MLKKLLAIACAICLVFAVSVPAARATSALSFENNAVDTSSEISDPAETEASGRNYVEYGPDRIRIYSNADYPPEVIEWLLDHGYSLDELTIVLPADPAETSTDPRQRLDLFPFEIGAGAEAIFTTPYTVQVSVINFSPIVLTNIAMECTMISHTFGAVFDAAMYTAALSPGRSVADTFFGPIYRGPISQAVIVVSAYPLYPIYFTINSPF